MRPQPNHFLGPEGERNRKNAALFQRLLRKAWGECEIIVGHHIGYEFAGDLDTEDEIPSADTLLFDHDIMQAVFGDQAMALLARIAVLKPYDREIEVVRALDALEAAKKAA